MATLEPVKQKEFELKNANLVAWRHFDGDSVYTNFKQSEEIEPLERKFVDKCNVMR